MRLHTFLLVFASACITVAQCPAASRAGESAAEAEYIRLRDAKIADVRRRDAAGGPITAAQTKADDAAIAVLEAKLQQIVGPLSFDGFSKLGKDNADTFSAGDVGFGALDALRFEGTTPRTTLYVTSEHLLELWLTAHRDWWKEEPLPQTIPAALRCPAFYTQAVSADSAVFLYAELPIKKPLGSNLVMAQLAADSQALVPPLPAQLIVTVIKNGRVAIVDAPLTMPFAPPPACKQFSKDAATGDAEDAGLRCFSQHAAETPEFPAATRQAQALVDLLVK